MRGESGAMNERDRPRMVRPQEAAALLNVSPRTIARWHQRGLLRGQRTLGGHRRYRLEDIERLAQFGR